MSGPLGLGLVGAGRMGRIHADIVARELPEARLVAVADLDLEAAARLTDPAAAYPTRDHHELLARDDVDAVLIVTPTRSHLSLIADAARARKAIFCEKPIALSVMETQHAVALAAEAGVRLQVGLYRRHDSEHVRARRRIRAGAIGRPQVLRLLQYDTFVPPPEFCDPSVSGGIAVDMGIHELDIAAWLIDDEIAEVHAAGAINADQRLAGVSDVDTLVAVLRFRSGALGTVELVRRVGYAEDVRTEVVGTDGSIFLGQLQASHSALAMTGAMTLDLPPSVIDRFRPALAAQLRSFCRAVRDGDEVEPTGADSIPALAAGIATRSSLELGRPVSL